MTSALGGMSRRVRTLAVSAALFVVLLILTMTLPVPYVVLSPGPTCNTLTTCPGETATIIKITGTRTRHTSGNLNLTTVSYTTNRLTIFDALRAWLDHARVVVPRSALFPPGQSTQQVNTQNKNDFTSSQDNAIVAASCELGYPKAFGVLTVLPKGPSDGVLEPGDVFKTIDGKPAGTYRQLKSVLESKQPGTRVKVVVQRNSSPTQSSTKTVAVTLGKPPQGATGGSLGITVPPVPVCLAPFQVQLGLNNEIGGPSAGMMFALGIIDKVAKNLTQGRFIAGTGTIDTDGTVGPIGGIALKMIAARDAGATVFLAPAGNCSDVVGNIPGGLQVVKVTTLHSAVQALQNLNNGKPVPAC